MKERCLNLNQMLLNLHRRAMPVLLFSVLCGAAFLWAQGADAPIVISDGSLTIDTTVPFDGFQAVDATTKSHPQAAKTVTKVVVTAGGRTQTINYTNQRCTVAVKYANTDIEVSTNNNGKGLRIKTDFASFRPGSKASEIAHSNANAKISSVTISRGTQMVFAATPSGGTKISISYQ